MTKFIDSSDVSDALNKAKKSQKIELENGNDTDLMDQYKRLLESTDSASRYAAITVKVSKQCRNYWQLEARKQKTSVTELVVQALLREFGLPDEPEEFLY